MDVEKNIEFIHYLYGLEFRDIVHCDTWKILLTATETITLIHVFYFINGIRIYGPSGRMLAFLLC